MSGLSVRLREKYFGRYAHPYSFLQGRIESCLRPDAVVLDAGCGRTAPLLARLAGKAKRLIGLDLVEFSGAPAGLELRRRDLADTGLPMESVAITSLQAVMEHVVDPDAVFAEMARVLKPGGVALALTANKWDYASIIARMIPNRFHPWIVRRTEGRAEADVFPTVYKLNTRRAVAKYARRHGLELAEFRYLGQYPSYFMFSGPLFMLATLYQKTIERFRPLHCLQGWIFFELRKPEDAVLLLDQPLDRDAA
jgi:SAM-dependent methyltransferase